MSQSKITLRALPNVDFVHGYPGIPVGPDRPQATVRGTIEVRLGNQPVRVKWIKVDVRKVETIPCGSNGKEFVDFVGQSPVTVWQAKEEDESISTKDYPFNIRLPETIPPSVALGRGAGIKYKVVATLCMKGKKYAALRVTTCIYINHLDVYPRGLLRREASTIISDAVPVVIDKHELHSTWPVYAQPESRQVTSGGLTLIVNRSNTCFAPADRVRVTATLKSENLSPVVLRGFEFFLKETIIYRAGPQSHGKNNGPQVQNSILGDQKVPVSMTLYGGTQHKVELCCTVPRNHTTSSVSMGRYIDVRYTMDIKAITTLAKPIVIELPVTITNWSRQVSLDMIRRIGTAPNLCLGLSWEPGGLATLSGAKDSFVTNSQGTTPVEFGYGRLGDNTPIPTLRQSLVYDSAKIIDVARRSKSLGNYQGFADLPTGNEPNNSGGARSSLNAQSGNVRASIASTTPSTRRPRAMSRTLQIVNTTEEMPEDDTPVKDKSSDDFPQSIQISGNSVSSPTAQNLPGAPWPTAEAEKQRLFNRAKSQAEKAQAVQTKTNVVAIEPVQDNSLLLSNNRGYPSVDQLVVADAPNIVSSPKPSWPTAEDEKIRLFAQAQAKVSLTQAIAQANQLSPANSSGARLMHHRTASSTSHDSKDNTRRPYPSASPPTISAGAALYSHAIASMKSPVMTASSSSQPSRIPTSQPGPSIVASVSSPVKQYVTAEDEKAAIRYLEARNAVERRHQEAAQEEVLIAYHALYPSESSNIIPPLSERAHFGQPPRKRLISSQTEAGEAGLASAQPISPAETFIATDGTQAALGTTSPPFSPPEPPSEKEVSRRAFEARDAAMLRSGQLPPAAAASIPSVSRQPSGWGSGSTPSYAGSEEMTRLSEKERMKIAFENRDRALAAQQIAPPPEYDKSPTRPTSVSPFLGSNGVGRKIVTEKALLEAQLKEKEIESRLQTGILPESSISVDPQLMVSERAPFLPEDPNITGNHENYLRRDPTISAGKKRASQLNPPLPPPSPPPQPPPLPPRPPVEYIEETKLEDMKNNIFLTLALPVDFTAPLELAFNDKRGANSSTSISL